jgi:hypothetical protein
MGLAFAAVACRGVVSSRTEVTPPPQVASSARVTGSGVANVVIDRSCSRLGDASDEYVCITNSDTVAVDMGSWILRNVLGRTYNFPSGFSLAAGQTVKVHTGAGTDSATDLHWSYRVNPAWEKSDKLTLHNNEDVEVFVSQ